MDGMICDMISGCYVMDLLPSILDCKVSCLVCCDGMWDSILEGQIFYKLLGSAAGCNCSQERKIHTQNMYLFLPKQTAGLCTSD